eukprot:364303-Chlamydomonas_euryale.AAC.8
MQRDPPSRVDAILHLHPGLSALPEAVACDAACVRVRVTGETPHASTLLSRVAPGAAPHLLCCGLESRSQSQESYRERTHEVPWYEE